MGTKFNWVEAGQVVEKDRSALHAWSTKNPFSLALSLIVLFIVVLALIHQAHERSMDNCRAARVATTGGLILDYSQK